MQEREAARKLNEQIDRLLSGEHTGETGVPVPFEGDELSVARRLRDWRERLPPVPVDLQRRVRLIVEAPSAAYAAPRRALRTRVWPSAAWGALVAAVVFLVVWMVAPSGQQVWAQMRRVLNLGQTMVELTPTLEPPSRAVREPLRDLVAVELAMGRAPSLPRTLPEGYELLEIVAVSYPDLSAWISQPFFVELAYGAPGDSPGLRLRQYRLMFREDGHISAFQPASELIAQLQEVDVSGARGALLTYSEGDVTYGLVWERDGLLLELETDRLEKEHLVRIAQTVR